MKSDRLQIFLNSTPVGIMTLLPGERIHFAFDQSYITNPGRPVLSQSFYNKEGGLLTEFKPTQVSASPFFANLLPEGHLRQYLAELGGIKPERDFYLLKLLGADLPGAVVIQSEGENALPFSSDKPSVLASEEGALHFSLAGVQLKFSAIFQRHGLTIPANGTEGNWIVKLPSAQFHSVPENEFAMLELAKAVGIEVPDIMLVPISSIEGLPAITQTMQGNALAIKRYDRTEAGRVHAEDFSQVFGVYPNNKYEKVSYNNIVQMLNFTIGEEGVYEFIRRFVFNLLIGNADMHLKNWSLIYPDGIHPQLAPAYDYVSTIVYLPSDRLALNFMCEKDMQKINRNVFKKLSSKLLLNPEKVLKIVDDTVEKFVSVWSAHSGNTLPPGHYSVLDKHIDRVVKNLASH